MKCPNCGKEMKYYSHSSPFGLWNDEDLYYLVEEWKCGKCRISYREDPWTKEWDIPGELQATQTQIKACRFVLDELGYDPPPPTKRAMWKFLHETLDEAKDSKEKRWIDNWDDYDYAIPEEDCY